MSSPYSVLKARECFQQVKTIHRLLLVLADDLGDLSALRDTHPFFGEASDLVSGSLEPQLQALREKLESLSGAGWGSK